ncbi:MAG: O-antigen ligase family protein [Flavobacteriales bacterium]|nr:O-antigen ligase family protein [Flavobacteriales bacterium]
MASPSGLLRGRDAFRTVHVAALALCAIALPWSKALLSMAQMLLVANWLAEGIARKELKERFRKVFTQAPSLIFLSFLLLHIIGLLWTSDLKWGMGLVRILAPVLVFGVVLSASPRLTSEELRAILLAGAWSAVASAGLSILLSAPGITDHRTLSRFISHIRLSLLLCMAVVVLLHYMRGAWWRKALHVLGIAAAAYALDRLESVQAVAILALIASATIWRWSARWKTMPRTALRVLLIAVPLATLAMLVHLLERHTRLPVPEESGWGAYTPGGEPYTFDAFNPQQENGRHVWAWVAWDEADRAWATRCERPLDGMDDRGEELRGTLARYMTSLGLRKDSTGVMALSDADIQAVLAGTTNAHRTGHDGLRERLDDLLQEMAQYRTMGRADGHSLAMRLEFLRTGLSIVKAHWVTGVGTGDTQMAFDQAYERTGSPLDTRWRLRAHDQYLTWAISFGVFGAAWLLLTIWWPAWRMGAWRNSLFIAWAITFGVSCLSDDTVETQVGATFFALYYTLLVFAAPPVNAMEAPPAAQARAAG